ncbi:MAG: glutamine synthetase family protein [Bacteroidota bacterium]|nr:glutamine synthetase family protein [Bacteroidota bacterium]
MKDSEILLNPNELVRYLKKPASEFTKNDIINFVEENEIEMLNFRYVGEDGKLKTLNFIISSKEHLETILSTGERVDGSSLFSFIEAGSSDLYVVPRFKTAFLNPFSEIPTVDILCSFYNSTGKPLESAPEYILKKAHTEFTKATGFKFKALGELEFYINYDKDDLYPAIDQKGYHESKPYAKFEEFRVEALELIGLCGGKVKYGHSEVGNFTKEEQSFEQHEIEFLPVNAEDAVDQMIIAKWVLRNLSNEYGVEISFAPKITVGKAGSGLHIHMMLEKDGKNVMVQDGKLSDISKRMMAGILDLSSSLTAFGNTIPTSYLRLVPHQEAPTNICWGDSNRSALVRVPLGWMGASNMIADANPLETVKEIDGTDKQTVEFRAPDGSADLYHLVAGLIVASQHGLEMDNALEIAEELYIDVNIFDDKNKERLEQLELLPASCFESAECLEKKRSVFEKNGVFPKGLVGNVIGKLKAFDDKDLSERLYGKDDEIQKLVHKYIHCM